MRIAANALYILMLLAVAAPAVRAADIDYTTQVKPLLTAHCTRCHGSLKQRSALRLDAATLLLKGGKHGPAIVAGKSSDSRLVIAISGGSADVPKMPAEGDPLKPEQIEIIKRWIDSGAKAPADEPVPAGPESHWSFKPPVRPSVPHVKDANWSRNPIDAFLASQHEQRSLAHQPEADKATLIRRVTLDLTGLPPTREELHAFLADTSPDAYEKLVDRLLASPRYGERWGRHWMDVWRYSDWAGYGMEIRYSQPHIWRWRDWIVESLNADKPYDQMVREMLAGDEIAPADPQTVRATGFLARSWSLYNRNGWMEDVVEHTGKAFLGMTFNCARCHDHMFDPVSQKEYYGFRAIFEPYAVRLDPVATTLDTKIDGVSRVYDANEKAPTFLFVRGDDRNPNKDEVIAPTVPASLGGKFEIAKVDVPAAAYYPGLAEPIRKQVVAAADAAVTAEQKALAQNEANATAAQAAYAKLAAPAQPAASNQVAGAPGEGTAVKAVAKPPAQNEPNDPSAAVVKSAAALWLANETVAISKFKVELAQLQRTALTAKIEADRARYATPPASDAQQLALAAGRAEQLVAVARGELEARRTQHELSKAQAAVKTGDAKSIKALTDAGLKVVESGAALASARAALDKPTSQYAPITTVYPTTSTGRRLALAKWITNRDNPLFARVAVNHIWLRHFGSGIVPTMFDFGLNGKPPTNQPLLDWLAVELADHGWNMKPIHRLMVTSAAYRMRSDDAGIDESTRKADPDNIYLWHANVRRMEAEIVRDNLLAVANQLDLTTGGPDIDYEQGLVSRRRSIYFRHAHEKQMTFLKIFDAASPNECYRRDQTVMPQQALALSNSPLALAESRRVASMLTNEVGGKPEPRAAFINAAFEQLLCRGPSRDEQSTCEQFLETQAARFRKSADLTPFTAGDVTAVPPSSDPDQRAREDLVHVLMNHNDFVTIR